MNAQIPVIAICLVAMGFSGCSSSASALSRSHEYRKEANYYQAYYELLAERQSGGWVDEEEFRIASIAFLLARGQNLVFNDHELLAMQDFEQVLELDPTNRVAPVWHRKCELKLASKAVADGDELRRSGDLEEALISYKDAMVYIEGFEEALSGIQAVADTVKQRESRAEDHYTHGVAALGEELYGTTWYHMVNAVEINPSLEKAKSRRDFASRRLIEDRYERAKGLEAEGFFAAALSEYSDLVGHSELEGLATRIGHMEKEVEAVALVREAEMKAFRRQYAEATALLEKAFATTVSQQMVVGDLLILVKERDLTDRYQDARFYEVENRLENALEVYREIDGLWPGFKEVKTRISDIESTVEIAENAFLAGQAAEKAGDLEGAVDAYSEAVLVYPGYKDLEAELERIQKKLDSSQ